MSINPFALERGVVGGDVDQIHDHPDHATILGVDVPGAKVAGQLPGIVMASVDGCEHVAGLHRPPEQVEDTRGKAEIEDR